MTASLTRRAALRMGGGLGLGGLLAGNGAVKAAPSLIPGGSLPSDRALPPPENLKSWDLFQKFELDHIEWRHIHKSRIDSDLFGMKSLSPTIRLIIQRQRDIGRRSTLARLRKTLGLR